jgi:prepilin-type processing-associated H-X9-DG protein
VKKTPEVPVFYDATWIDNINMHNGTPTAQPTPPPNLQGTISPAGPNNNDWRILLARHGRAINVCFADGHAATVKVEETYRMLWTPYWLPYTRTNLPKRS